MSASMTELFTAIGNFGFPIVVSLYLLIRLERKLEILTKAIDDNNNATKQLVDVISRTKFTK